MSVWIVGSALWLGILTAISPCPLATNIAAISFIGRQGSHRKAVLLSGLFYTLGRTLTYVLLGMMITSGLLAAAQLSQFLQKYMNEILGPILIVLGMVLLGWLGSTISLNLAGEGIQKRAEKGGVAWSTLLGVLFALSFCPISAGLFFAGLIPLAIKQDSRLLLPTMYGMGTALPVLLFAFLLTFAATTVGNVFNRLTTVERCMRVAVGVLFLLTGLYYCLAHIYGITF